MNRTLLEDPFLPHQIKQRQGAHGMIDYIEGHAVIQRLNDAFDGDWCFDVIHHEIREDLDEVVVLGRLSAGEVTKTQFGNSRLACHRETGKIISLGDDLKAAATDALKKCATLLGVGLHLYRAEKEADSVTPEREVRKVASPQTQVRHQPSMEQARISTKQHRYLQSLIRKRSLTRREVDTLCRQRFGAVMDHLSRAEASTLIEDLKSEKPLPAAS